MEDLLDVDKADTFATESLVGILRNFEGAEYEVSNSKEDAFVESNCDVVVGRL